MTPEIHRYASLPSTNIKANELAAAGALHGEVVVAQSQSAGRGRLGKTWQSPPERGLYFSIILRPQILPVTDYAKISLAAGLAVANVLEKLCALATQLKWPNDVYLGGRKCCGILAESSLSENVFIVLGIGINVNTTLEQFPEEIRKLSTSLWLESGKEYDLDQLLRLLYKEVMSQFNRLEDGGFAGILAEWRKKDMLLGNWLEWVTNSGEIVYGRSEGPDDEGILHVRDRQGRLHEVISGDVRLAKKNAADA